MAQAPPGLTLRLFPQYGAEPLQPNRLYAGQGLECKALRFYVSQIELYEADQLVWAETNSFHLVDLAKPDSWQLGLAVPAERPFSTLRFHIGIDSLTSVSGAMGGDLDPTQGMYWTWQSGYIHFKLEGRANDQPFEFHIGGYQAPYNMLQTVSLAVSETRPLHICMDLRALLEEIDWATTHHIMQPSQSALDFARRMPAMFKLCP